jgi:4-guanidinobutyraldehyde dehydrogenase / NAD-dependent aldehyde dehydrogenase
MTIQNNNINWQKLRDNIKLDGRAFINGKRMAAADGQTFDCISPIDGKKIAEIARCGIVDVELAVQAARTAFEDGRWAKKSPKDRKNILINFSRLIRENGETLALMETLDMGKPVNYSLNVDVNSATNTLQWYGECIDKVYDEIAPTADNALGLITREAIGVVAAIVPWNYPMIMAAWKIAPALAAGNSVILKPSEKSPLTALKLAEIALEAGIPEGVFNVLPGYGEETGGPLALHMDIDCIAFTGSTNVGKKIMQYAGQSNLKRAWAELGGKSPFIVFADADIDAAAETCINAIFFNQGESCNAPTRLIIDKKVEAKFIEKALSLMPNFQPANPLINDTVMGAIVDEIQLNNVMRYIEIGKAEGAECITGGKRVLESSGGYYVSPTIFSGVNNAMTIAREEIFGPVLSIIPFSSAQEGIRIANDTPYGLAASVWSRDISQAHLAAKALRAGTIHVNCYDEDDITVPFGGYKQSGNGRDKSLHALEKYTELKTTWIKLA